MIITITETTMMCVNFNCVWHPGPNSSLSAAYNNNKHTVNGVVHVQSRPQATLKIIKLSISDNVSVP